MAFGFKSNRLAEIDSFQNYVNQYKRGFDSYFTANFFGQIIPWQSYLKSPSSNKNAISFSINKMKFQNNAFIKNQKLYFKRILNNSFVKNVEKNNERVKNIQNQRNQFFLNFHNNKRQLFNCRTDYSLDINFSESINKDSIYLDLKYYSKKNKEVNLLIPDILQNHFTFNKYHFDLGNHIDANIEINRIISIFIGNNKFIKYGAYE